MKVSVIGTGYVGLVSGVCLAKLGNTVCCVDIDATKVNSINQGMPPIHENELPRLLHEVLDNGQFSATTDLEKAVNESDLTLLAVGTPFDGEHIDLSFIEIASRQIGTALKSKTSFHTVVVKSTVVPGTTDNVVGKILESESGRTIGDTLGLGMNPEFLREGVAIADFMNPDRIVLGACGHSSLDAMHKLYAGFPHTEKLDTTPRTAEMIKYTANSLLATLISFSNEIGNLCAAVRDIDIEEVMQGVWLDKRISPFIDAEKVNGASGPTRCVPDLTGYLRAGCGFGGSCFPKDVSALIAYGKQHGNPMELLDSVMSTNAHQPQKLVELVVTNLGFQKNEATEATTVAVLGLAFKPGTDDVRESAAIPIVNGLLEKGYNVKAFDPVALENAAETLGLTEESNKRKARLSLSNSMEDCIEDAAAIVVVTAWQEFKDLPKLVSQLNEQPVIVDGRRMFEPSDFSRYAGIGLMSSQVASHG